jgi:hypothetical protein
MAKFWLPRTCSENQGCIFEVSGSALATLDGLSKTCRGHSGDFGRTIGVPSTGIIHNAPLAGDQAVFDTIRTQNKAGTEESAPAPFIYFDEARIGDLTSFGMPPILVLYRSQLHPGGDQSLPPNPTFIRNSFASLFATFGDVPVVLDLEGYYQGGGSQAIPANRIAYFETFIDIAHEYWSDVGLYAGIPERYTLYLTQPTGGATYTQRYNDWVARCQSCQVLFDKVNTIYPSLYFLNPTHLNSTLRDIWYQDNYTICQQLAPGKPVYPFMWPLYQISVPEVNLRHTDIPGAYWRSALEKVYTIYPGAALFLESGYQDPRTQNPVPGWWTENVDFCSDKGLVA